jgi:hypothetical protein
VEKKDISEAGVARKCGAVTARATHTQSLYAGKREKNERPSVNVKKKGIVGA